MIAEIGDLLVDMLLGEFRFFLKKLTQENLEGKVSMDKSEISACCLLLWTLNTCLAIAPSD